MQAPSVNWLFKACLPHLCHIDPDNHTAGCRSLHHSISLSAWASPISMKRETLLQLCLAFCLRFLNPFSWGSFNLRIYKAWVHQETAKKRYVTAQNCNYTSYNWKDHLSCYLEVWRAEGLWPPQKRTPPCQRGLKPKSFGQKMEVGFRNLISPSLSSHLACSLCFMSSLHLSLFQCLCCIRQMLSKCFFAYSAEKGYFVLSLP